MLECWLCRLAGKTAKYIGESSRSAFQRGKEHLAAVRRGDTTNAIGKHYALKHPDWDGEQDSFTFTVLKTPRLVGKLHRYIAEALKIREAVLAPPEHLNSKGEWARITLRRQGILHD